MKRDDGDNPLHVTVEGHTLFAPHGSDIVCAAVSVLTQTVVFAVQDLLGVTPKVVMEKGFLSVETPENLAPESKEKYNLLLETMLLGLKEIASSYPEQLVYCEEQR